MSQFEQLYLDTAFLEPSGANFEVNLEFIVFQVSKKDLKVLTLPAGDSPFEGDLALPMRRLGMESHITTGRKYISQELGIDSLAHLEQITAYTSSKKNSPVRQLNMLLLGLSGQGRKTTRRQRGSFTPLTEISSGFGSVSTHDQHMILLAREFLSSLIQNTTVATLLCPDQFTLGTLRRVYECVWDTPLDNANFRRKILATDGFVEFVSKAKQQNKQGRPSHLYKSGSLDKLNPSLQRPLFST
jgi:8-oxo-dGTP diphosphatase